MKHITHYSRLDENEVVLKNGTRWTVPCARLIDITFWRYGDPVESEDDEPGAYLHHLASQNLIPAKRVDKASGREGKEPARG